MPNAQLVGKSERPAAPYGTWSFLLQVDCQTGKPVRDYLKNDLIIAQCLVFAII